MTYARKFSLCRTTGECRRIKVTLLCTAQTDFERYLIEQAYEKRCREIRPEWHGGKPLEVDELEQGTHVQQ